MLNLVKSRLSGKILFFIFIFILLFSCLYSTIINVPTPYTTIQAGITAAVNGDTVLVQPGTYYENINYNGKNITVASLFLTIQNTTYISSTIIDGNSSGHVVTFENGEDSTAVLCGFAITNGSANYGGGIYCSSNSSPSLENLIITGNSANYGGGIYCGSNSSPSLQNVTISGSSADHGGGVYCSSSSPSLQDVTITGNSTFGYDHYGGGIYCGSNSSLSLQNVTITGNSANAGGGIYCSSSSPSLQNVTITGNTAFYNGGGIYCEYSSSLSLINSILWNDSPEEIYNIYGGSTTATYSDIQGSWAGTGNIDNDPFFVDPANGDYHLQSASPCIDAGDPASPLDPDGTITDMGAYYFHQHFGPVWFISTTGSDITGNGTEQYPFATIQNGINYSSDTDTVLVQPGTYVEHINFNGKLITVGSLFLTTRNATYISSTIIDGNSSGSVVTFNDGEDSTTVLCGFTITNGLAGVSPYDCGGGIICFESSPSLQNVTISGNTASADGGGIYIYECSPSLENVIISGNTASYQGGGICCYNNSSLGLQNVTISANIANDNGGGIFCSNSNPNLVNVTITGNTASGGGGGIYCEDSTPSLINSILWNDSPEEIYTYYSSITATYSDIQGGWAGTGNIDSDPLFVDPANGDYHLTASSPCIDSGDPASPLNPDGTIADMGAYYFNLYNGPIWYISTTGSDLTGSGSEQYPFATIQHGINYSSDTDTVLVQPGTYVENINFNGKLITVGSLFFTTMDTTYISSTTIDGNNSGKVVIFDNNEDSTAVLSGFTITNGLASGSSMDNYGGGIYCYDTGPSLENLIITGNTASYDGGGICCVGSNLNPSLKKVTILDNSASNDGGGIYCDNSNPNLQNVTILANSASGTYGKGGGIYCRYSNPILENVTISSNLADGYGGGIYCDNSSPILLNVTISGNSSSTAGGGICCSENSSLNLNNVTISGNSAGWGAGIYCEYPSSSLSLINSILWNNSPDEISNHPSSIITVTYSDIQGGFTGTGNIDSDPLFADPLNSDYHLTTGSPCIDAGDPASPLDPDCTITDMGAYFFSQYDGPIWHISTTGSDLTGIGSEQFPFATIQHGINCSSDTDTVLVQPGTYVENINYSGKLVTLGSLFLTTQDTTYISLTYIDGNSSGSVVTFNNGEDSTAVLCGFTITNGDNDGGGIYCHFSSPSLQYITVSGNSANNYGGGIYCNYSSPILYNVTISDNTDSSFGGGIYCANSSPNLQNITISGNSANYGGGIYCNYSSPILYNVTISDNTDSSFGGGIYCANSSPNLQNITISGHSASMNGGGICCYNNSSPVLQNITISGNSANYGGGIYCSENSSPNLQNVTISGNSANGGGIYCSENSSPSLQNVTISGNSASMNGGGIYCKDSSSNPILQNVTISDNSASYQGGGIYCYNNASLSLINSILWNDSPQEIYIESGSVIATYTDIQGGWTGMGNIDSDPLFMDPLNSDYHLTASSPCIDAGDPTSPLDPDSTIIEMGAYYFSRQYVGRIWHISTSGSDTTGNGTEPYPFATLQHGINYSTDFDTVLVQTGTYLENINYNGKLITVCSLFLTTQDTTYISSTTIDGDSIGSVVTFNNSEDSTAVLSGFTITNGSNTYGGGINCNNSSSPSLKNLTITGNYASSYGGGIDCYYYSSPSLQNVTISGNSAATGGGIYCDDSSPSLQNVTISGNSAVDFGGGIYCRDNSNPSFENITITGNFADYGGGINCSHSSNPSFENITISGNSAGSDGGGIYCYNNASPSLINSILWNDSPQEIYIQSGSVTATYSDIEGGWTGTGNIDSDPLFVDPTNGDYHLSWANFPIRDGTMSPCIDAGDQALPFEPDGTITDIGAFYYHQNSGPLWHISTTGSDLTGNGTDLYPFATIQKGINYSADADTVLVQPGTYVENINYNGKLIKVGSLFLTTQDTTYISSTTIDGNNSGRVVTFEYGEDSTAVLCGITLTNGLASGDPPANCGGGIYCYESNPSLQNITISGNTADYGGGVLCEMSSPSLENITITGNSATYSGGGIYFYDNSSPSLENVTITGNSANRGGGILCYYYSSPSLENVTISGNIASEDGGGIYCQDSSLNLINSILWNDSPQEIYIVSGGIVTAIYSNIYGGWTGTGNIDEDPLFVDPGNGNYHLQSNSPCIDAGDPASPLDPDSTVADMGAYYFHQITALDPPQNVTIEIIGTDVHLSWDAVTGANLYKVYSSDDPYTGFVEDTSGSFAGETWSAPIGDVKKFYHVIASTETIRFKDSDSQDAYHPDRKSRRYEPDKFINRKRK